MTKRFKVEELTLSGCMGLLGMVAAHYFGAKSVIISYRYKFQGDLAAKIGTELGLEVKTVESCSVVDYFTGMVQDLVFPKLP